MPRIDFVLKDRLYILKVISTVHMTYSSFIMLVYLYLIALQDWTYPEDKRIDVMKFKWSVIVICILDFGNGTLLALATNMDGIRSKRGIIAWIVLETFLIPVSIFILKELLHKMEESTNKYSTDLHYSRVNIAQIFFLLSQYLFMGYALDFIAVGKPKTKTYDPNVRPETVDAPTDPQITTTESRHIRLSQSFFTQPSLSKRSKTSEGSNKQKDVRVLNKKGRSKSETPKINNNERNNFKTDDEEEEEECSETETRIETLNPVEPEKC